MTATHTTATSSFTPFDSTSELWADYWKRFCTFAGANSVPDDKKAQVFLTNQSVATFKLLSNLAEQQTPPKDINNLTMEEIIDFMKSRFDPKLFVVRERYKFWSDMHRKPGETIQEVAARVRQKAATCDFASIKDAQDEALRTNFMCSVDNEAVLTALFQIKDDELDFERAIQVAEEVEHAAIAAKETRHGKMSNMLNKVSPKKDPPQPQKPAHTLSRPRRTSKAVNKDGDKQPFLCFRCGQKDHKADECKYKSFACNFCHRKGHLEVMCRTKKRQARLDQVKYIREKGKSEALHAVLLDTGTNLPKLEVPVRVD
ncbi:hypothetical protein, partial [Klebsiella pneumoniae]|uniref:hypothetical protein n=1 Tax=Klebsiella pneumoniae TaxID=573 RepID=UPI003EBCB829